MLQVASGGLGRFKTRTNIDTIPEPIKPMHIR